MKKIPKQIIEAAKQKSRAGGREVAIIKNTLGYGLYFTDDERPWAEPLALVWGNEVYAS